MRGEDVKELQIKLGRKSFRQSADSLDGKFGRKTRADVVHFQTTHGLTPDGVVGPKTWNGLDLYTPGPVDEQDEHQADELFSKALAAHHAKDFALAIELYTAVLALPATTTKEMTVGSLINRGICHAEQKQFAKAVADLTRALDATHISPARRNAALGALRSARQNLSPDDPAGTPAKEGDGGGIVARPDLAPGATGPAVETLQMKLFATQVITFTRQPEAGTFDAPTAARLKVFKGDMGMSADPLADAATWHALDSFIPDDRTDADRQRFLDADRASATAHRADPTAALPAHEALVDAGWSPELRALGVLRRALSLHQMGAFAAAVATYREALEMPRMQSAVFEPSDRAAYLENIARAKAGRKLPS